MIMGSAPSRLRGENAVTYKQIDKILCIAGMALTSIVIPLALRLNRLDTAGMAVVGFFYASIGMYRTRYPYGDDL